MSTSLNTEFERAAEVETERGLFREIWDFLKITKKWWLLPMILVFSALGFLMFLSGTAAAPFIYTLF